MGIFDLLQLGLPTILISLLWLWIQKYVAHKAELQAQKEEIENITQKVETIKSKLQVLAHMQSNIYNDEKNSLVKMHNLLSEYMKQTFQLKYYVKGKYVTADEHYSIITRRSDLEIEATLHTANCLLYVDETAMDLVNDCLKILGKINEYEKITSSCQLQVISILDSKLTPSEIKENLIQLRQDWVKKVEYNAPIATKLLGNLSLNLNKYFRQMAGLKEV